MEYKDFLSDENMEIERARLFQAIESLNISFSAAARSIGIAWPTFFGFINGKRVRYLTLYRIVRWTNGVLKDIEKNN